MKKIFLLALAATALTSHAEAGPVNYSKPYLKGGIGYAQQHYVVEGKTSTKFKGKGLAGVIGWGYSWQNNLRGELEIYMDNGILGSGYVGQTKYKSEIKTYAGLVNVAYDFNNSSQVTPFLMAGIGYGKNRFEVHGGNTSNGFHSAKNNKMAFMYQFGAGVDLKFDKKVSLEVSYRALNKGTRSLALTSDNGQRLTGKRHGDFQHMVLASIKFNV